MRSWKQRFLGLCLMAAACTAAAQVPGGIAVSPVRVDLNPGERGSAVTLTNTGTSRKTIQVETFAWSQANDDDVYAPTLELIVNPPLFFLEPGKSQVVRVGRSAAMPAGAAAERSFRIYFREVPDEAAPGGQMLRVALRIGIPVFIVPASESAAPQLEWSGVIRADGSAELFAANRGSEHARVAEVRVLGEGPQVLARAEGFHYVLPQARRRWLLPAPARVKPGAVRVAVQMEEGAREYPLVLRSE